MVQSWHEHEVPYKAGSGTRHSWYWGIKQHGAPKASQGQKLLHSNLEKWWIWTQCISNFHSPFDTHCIILGLSPPFHPSIPLKGQLLQPTLAKQPAWKESSRMMCQCFQGTYFCPVTHIVAKNTQKLYLSGLGAHVLNPWGSWQLSRKRVLRSQF